MPGQDIVIPIRIPEAYVANAQLGFFTVHSVPAEFRDPPDPETGIVPPANAAQKVAYVKEWLRGRLAKECHRGLQKIASDAAEFGIDQSMVELDS